MNNKRKLKCLKCFEDYIGHYNTELCKPCKSICKYCDRKIKDNSRGSICSSCRNKKYTYKLTEKEMYRWLAAENCDCCGKPFKNHKQKNQDHNHTTGVNRGLICSACNIFVGFIETQGLEDAIKYLIKYNNLRA